MNFKNLIGILSKIVYKDDNVYYKDEIEYIKNKYDDYECDINKTIKHLKKESERCLREYFSDRFPEGKKIHDTEQLFIKLYEKYSLNK